MFCIDRCVAGSSEDETSTGVSGYMLYVHAIPETQSPSLQIFGALDLYCPANDYSLIAGSTTSARFEPRSTSTIKGKGSAILVAMFQTRRKTLLSVRRLAKNGVLSIGSDQIDFDGWDEFDDCAIAGSLCKLCIIVHRRGRIADRMPIDRHPRYLYIWRCLS